MPLDVSGAIYWRAGDGLGMPRRRVATGFWGLGEALKMARRRRGDAVWQARSRGGAARQGKSGAAVFVHRCTCLVTRAAR
ncbi:hypothetical protein C7402_12336 [Paraburkholderia unamae]|uniref:Uncharacterized protein n=1 Tax=Paraburkholderia unamae TaxID=219649 RepID=A0ABX5KF28_9BURK|nr:hypothetical protein C7402_12336 [Paraburkholderia unamae]CAG9272490.1 hypothetical protein PUN4_700033 [Paraburkholderia unamae]